MTNWKQTLDIKKVLELGPELNDNAALPDNIRTAMKTEIGRVMENLRDEHYEDLLEELDEISTVTDFNAWLNCLFDWADRNLIWCGAM